MNLFCCEFEIMIKYSVAVNIIFWVKKIRVSNDNLTIQLCRIDYHIYEYLSSVLYNVPISK